METQVETGSEVGVSTLVGGIVDDAKKLLTQQLTLFQVEIKNDVHRTVNALSPLLVGLVVVLAGLIILGMGGAQLLCWLFADLPLWAGYAIVGGTTALIGALLVLSGKTMLDMVSPTPDTALKGLKENLQWKTKN
jgi:uncharacterized membrane protein YqjE